MRRVVVVACGLLVVLAGCNGVVDSPGETSTPTVTPAPVPVAEPSATPAPRLGPGLTGESVSNASALAAAHDAALGNTSFTVRRTVTYRTENGTAIRHIASVRRVGPDGRFRVTRRWNGTTALEREEYYGDGETVVIATTDTNDTTTYRRAPTVSVAGRSVVAGTGSEQIEAVFVAGETRVAGRTQRDGTTVYRLTPDRDGADGSTADTTDPLGRSATVRARVTAGGLVREYTLHQTLSGENSNGAAVIVVSARYTGVGSTMVERPAWYETAVAETNGTVSNRTTTSLGLRASAAS